MLSHDSGVKQKAAVQNECNGLQQLALIVDIVLVALVHRCDSGVENFIFHQSKKTLSPAHIRLE